MQLLLPLVALLDEELAGELLDGDELATDELLDELGAEELAVPPPTIP